MSMKVYCITLLRHIMIHPDPMKDDAEAEKAVQDFMQEVHKENPTFEIFTQLYSFDGEKGGDWKKRLDFPTDGGADV